MGKNLIIGMGGTGAKIVESFVHLCGAGLGPDDCAVAFVDQDMANGNTSRARTALGLYMEARQALRDPNLGVRLDGDTDLLRTRLVPHGVANYDEAKGSDRTQLQSTQWTPHVDAKTLGELIDYQSLRGNHRHLADLFFANDAEELQMNLDAGYRGRPHIGSAALLAQMRKDTQADGSQQTRAAANWMTALDEIIADGNKGPVRIFLCGSAFGGTGAATLPTLARDIAEKAKNLPDVAVSAVLMLPYFDFTAPSEGQESNVAQSPYLRQQTKAALDYYKRLLDAEGIFKRVYLLGWDPLFPLGYHEKGQQNQINPPLVPEFYAALAASHALHDDVTDRHANSVVSIGRDSAKEVTWNDLPTEVADRNLQLAFGQMLRFSALWHFAYRNDIPKERDRGFMGVGAESWYKEHFGRAFRKDTDAPLALKKVDDYIAAFLEYCALIAARSQSPGGREGFKLWNHHPIGNVDIEGDPRAGVSFASHLNDRPSELKALVGRMKDQNEPPGYKQVHERLTNYRSDKGKDGRSTQGVVPFIEALWAVSTMQEATEGPET